MELIYLVSGKSFPSITLPKLLDPPALKFSPRKLDARVELACLSTRTR